LIAASLVYFGVKSIAPAKSAPQASNEGGYFFVERVVDGDTLKLSNGKKVRLIGVDTPELHESDKLSRDAARSRKDASIIKGLGKKASDFTKGLVQGKRVRLEYDIKKNDRYGRILGYLYLEDGTFVNAKILSEGYGQVMTIQPNVKYADYFLKLERQARQDGKGLWKTDDFGSLK
jgi:micrococcal nuclease